jgi:hypothetical protein
MSKKKFKFDPTGKTITAKLKAINKKQQEDDSWHLKDVFQRLVDGECQIGDAEPDTEMSAEDATDWIFEHISEIIELGREGWNPFDTIEIITEGEPGEGWPA